MNKFFNYNTYLETINEKRTGKSKPKEETFNRWKKLINMSPGEISGFLKSENGSDAGLSNKKANILKIHTGKQSAGWVIKLLNKGVKSMSFEEAKEKLSDKEWYWIGRQVSFNSRALGQKSKKNNPYYKENSKGEVMKTDKGELKMTRWLKAMLIWGHDPRK